MLSRDTPTAPLLAPGRVRLGLGVVLAGLLGFLALKAEWRHGMGLWWTGDKVKLALLVQSCYWWGAVAGSAVLSLLWVTARHWARPWAAPFSASTIKAPRWFWLSIAGLMLAGAACRAPRLGLSLYNDEAHVFRAQLAGRLALADLGKPEKFRPATWLTTLYENRAGNNSMPFSIAARASYDAWRGLTHTAQGVVNETALRLPVFCCGVLAIGAMAWLGLRLGGPWLGLTAALLSTFHPWHLRYSVEARSYGIMFLVLPLLFLALHTALRTGRWRWWLVFGFMEYAAVAVWFGSAHLLVALNLTLAAMAFYPAWRARRVQAVQASLIVPTLVAGLLAAGLYLQFNLPHYVQLAKSLADPLFFKTPHPFPLAWFQDTGGFLGFGTPGLSLNPGNPAQPTVAGWLADPLWRFPAGAAILLWLGGGTAGIVRFCRQGGTALALTGAFTGGALLTLIYCTAKGIVFLKWYTLFLLPGLLLLLAAGLTARLKNQPPRWRGLLLLPLVLCWIPSLLPYLSQSRENLRGAVALARGTAFPASLGNPHQTLYAVLWSESPIYDHGAVTLKTTADLDALVSRARQENRPLFVAHGHTGQARASAPELLNQLENPSQFHPPAVLPGLDDSSNTHFIYQLIP